MGGGGKFDQWSVLDPKRQQDIIKANWAVTMDKWSLNDDALRYGRFNDSASPVVTPYGVMDPALANAQMSSVGAVLGVIFNASGGPIASTRDFVNFHITDTDTGAVDVAYNSTDGTWCAVGSDVATSSDGVNWIITNTGTAWSQITYMPDVNLFWVMDDDGNTATSRGGVSFTAAGGLPTGNDNSNNFVAYNGDGTLVVVFGSGTLYAVSTDHGATWSHGDLPHNDADGQAFTVCWNEPMGLFVVPSYGGAHGAVWTSPDGATWTEHESALPPNDWQSITSLGAKVCAVAFDEAISATSTDGHTWNHTGTFPAGFGSSVGYLTASASFGLFLATGSGGHVGATSTDGLHWTDVTFPSGSWWGCFAT